MGAKMTDEYLLERIRGLWLRLDPLPLDLVDAAVVLVEATGVLQEYSGELKSRWAQEANQHFAAAGGLNLPVQMLPSLPVPTSVRGRSETFRFADAVHETVMRTSTELDGQRRLDGWISPVFSGTAIIHVGDIDRRCVLSSQGRFQFHGVPTGTAVVWFESQTDQPDGRSWYTPAFEL